MLAEQSADERPDGLAGVVLICLAKWPGSGAAKTRLTEQLAASRSAPSSSDVDSATDWARRASSDFVTASLSDLLTRFGSGALDCERVLLYAPPTEPAREWFATLLRELGVDGAWRLLPVLSTSSSRSSDLGELLADAMRRARDSTRSECTVFIGADCPELPVHAFVGAATRANRDGVASICPASDGGYTLLALPASADAGRAFSGVRWSAPDTCLSQLAALSRAGLLCHVGDTYADVDELDDLLALRTRLLPGEAREVASPASLARAVSCPHTVRMLERLVI